VVMIELTGRALPRVPLSDERWPTDAGLSENPPQREFFLSGGAPDQRGAPRID
jgi:hypothetical protein